MQTDLMGGGIHRGRSRSRFIWREKNGTNEGGGERIKARVRAEAKFARDGRGIRPARENTRQGKRKAGSYSERGGKSSLETKKKSRVLCSREKLSFTEKKNPGNTH